MVTRRKRPLYQKDDGPLAARQLRAIKMIEPQDRMTSSDDLKLKRQMTKRIKNQK